MIKIEDFKKIDMRVGTILESKINEKLKRKHIK